MMRIRTSFPLSSCLLFTLLVAAGACSDEAGNGPVGPGSPPLSPVPNIRDAAHDEGNDRFYFLPPLVPASEVSGTFDASLSPVVRVCEGPTGACAGNETALFTTETGPGSETVRVVPEDEQYLVSWHTDLSDLTEGATYRINVLVAGTPLGHVDVVPVSSGSALKNEDTGEEILLKEGKTLPVKFRIEMGAVFVVGPAGGDFAARKDAVRLGIAEESLDETVGITVQPGGTVPAEAGLIAETVWDFGPEGLAFDPPARLTLRYPTPAPVAEAELTLLTESDGLWREITASTVDEAADEVTGPIDGFSRKVVGRRAILVTIAPEEATLEVEETVQLTARAFNPVDRELERRRFEWTTGNPSVATVDASGLVTAVGNGETYVEVRTGSFTARATIIVRPERTRIAFESERGGTGVNIWVVEVDPQGTPLGSPVQVTTAGGRRPALSPDGRFIAFESSREDISGSVDIWVVEIDDTGAPVGPPVPVVATDAFQDRTPTWSPDGRHIAYSSFPGHPENPCGFCASDIFVIEIDQNGAAVGNPLRVTRDPVRPPAEATDDPEEWPGGDDRPDWSADGSLIAFTRERNFEGIHIWSVEVGADGTPLRDAARVTTGYYDIHTNPAWSPDGRRLAFNSNRDEGDGDGSQGIWVMEMDETGGALGDPVFVFSNFAHTEREPAWSPIGHTLAFESNVGGSLSSWDVWVVELDEQSGQPLGSPSQTTTHNAADRHPTWSVLLEDESP